MRLLILASAAAAITACASLRDDTIHVPMALTSASGPGASIGEIVLKRGGAGVELKLNLRGLPPGQHGFHLHTAPSCETTTNAEGVAVLGGGAGGHLDPAASGHHMGPMGQGHLGDLPVLLVNADGTARQILQVTRFHSPEDFAGHALVIHAGGDNYGDAPLPLGGGGVRLACGVVAPARAP